MNSIEHIKNNFKTNIAITTKALEILAEPTAKAADMLLQCLRTHNKILSCGNGGSASDAMHFTAELLNRFVKERPSLPALSLTADSATLTAIANDYDYAEVFSKQISGLGAAGDILVAISTSGNSENITRAIQAAHAKNMPVIALTGRDGGNITKILHKTDIELRVPAEVTARIQEIHILVIHCLCDLIDTQLFPDSSSNT